MQSVLYWLEDHFYDLAETCRGRYAWWAARQLSYFFAGLGDALAMKARSRALLMPPEEHL
jgi:hypothetical protein